MATGAHLILYDGVCGLCNRLIQFVLARDRGALFHFAPLQSDIARRLLLDAGVAVPERSDDLTTVYVIREYRSPEPTVLTRSAAALFILDHLPGWRLFGRAGRLLPPAVTDPLYDLVARTRYRVFGRHDVCPLPDPAVRNRFVG